MDYRYIARMIIEATTPLFVGSGDASLLTDSLVQKDHNGLPLIPGTSIAGVLRHALEDKGNNKEVWEGIFGYQDRNDGRGSRLKVSSAYFLLGDNKVAEGLDNSIDQDLMRKMNNLPTRQHVKITDKGVAIKGSLFDNEIVYKGARFIFEIELVGKKEDNENWSRIIEEIKSPSFRIGHGTRNGYGNLKVIRIFEKCYELSREDDFNSYLNFNSSFNASLNFEDVEDSEYAADYTLCIEPDDFFIFSEGFGDDEVDNQPKTEEVMEYELGKINFKEKTLIPASSIKGAIAHRVCYHFNRLTGNFADQMDSEKYCNYLGDKNEAVANIFGEKSDVENNKNTGQRGILIMDDLYFDDIDNSKILNHVAIDRFTGGAIDGALFSEKVSYKKDKKIELKIYLSEPVSGTIEKSLEDALADICKGLLPLGGMTTKGHGAFTGSLIKKGKEEPLFSYNQKSEV